MSILLALLLLLVQNAPQPQPAASLPPVLPPGFPALPPIPEMAVPDSTPEIGTAPEEAPRKDIPAAAPAPVDELGLGETVRQLIEGAGLAEAVWTVVVRDVRSDSVLLRMNPHVIKPASNLKLLSSAAFLHQLGPEFTYTTGFWLRGAPRGEVWQGDLVVVGSGDPTIGAPWLDTPPLGVFERVADSLRARGITRIDGDLIGVESLFDSQPYPVGWSWDDITFYYAVQNGPLSFHENTVGLTVHADTPIGAPPRVEWFPYSTDYVTFQNRQRVIPSDQPYDEGYLRMPGTNFVQLTSSLPRGMVEEEAIAVHDPGGYFMDTLHKTLLRCSIQVAGRVRTTRDTTFVRDSLGLELAAPWDADTAVPARELPPPVRLASYQSPDLRVLLREMNQESSNFISEMLAKTVAAMRTGHSGSTEEGVSVIREQLADLGIDTARVHMQDASGMSPGNRLSADELNRLLVLMSRHPHAEAYRQSLAVAGRSGTLERRLTRPGRFCPGGGSEQPAEALPPGTPSVYERPCLDRPGAFAGKSGYISGVRTLSGYLNTASGREVAVTLATNQFIGKVSQVDRVQEAILTLLHENIP